MATIREFRLAIECCRSAYSGAGCPSELDADWPAFLGLVRFHRVQGLAWRSLQSAIEAIPPPIAEGLARDAAEIAAANLRAAAESRELLADFEGAGVPLLFVKGLTLAALAYGGIAIKSGVDVDLLVAADQLGNAAELLRNRGYRIVEPAQAQSAGRLKAWHGRHKESVWANDRIQIDLHTRLSDNPELIPSVGMGSRRQLVEISDGIRLPTLAVDELFAYLTVHGSSSAWFRLKWITDLAALIHRFGGGDVDRLYRRSQELGAGRAAAQALLLADTLYGTLDDCAVLRNRLMQDRMSRWLFRAAFDQLRGDGAAIEPTSRPLGTAIIHLTQFGLLPGPGFKLRELVRQARGTLG